MQQLQLRRGAHASPSWRRGCHTAAAVPTLRSSSSSSSTSCPRRTPAARTTPLRQPRTAGVLPPVVAAAARPSGSAAAAAAPTAPPPAPTHSNDSSSSSSSSSDVFEPNSLLDEVPAPKNFFNWTKQWYPLAIEADLPRELPSHQQLLGLDLALWWDRNADGGGAWRAFADRCPHRLAPLSEGIIEPGSGNLYCSYHGWTFEGASGRCVNIPQLPPGQGISAARSCVTSYPTCVREGLLWVWPDASPGAASEAAAPEAWPGLAPEIDRFGNAAFSATAAQHKWYARDLPYPYLAAKENAFNDVSHDQVLHHGVSAFADRSRAKPIPMRVASIGPNGYTVREQSGAFEDVTRFPCGARRQHPGHAGVAYVVPIAVGRCRQFHTFLTPDPAAAEAAAAKLPPLARLRRWAAGAKPTWAQHVWGHVLIDADIAIQARVDANRALSDKVYMPAAADAGPAAFMRWLKEYGGGGPPVTKLRDPFVGQASTVTRDRRQLLDRWSQHTQHCTACRTAHARFVAARKVAGVVALVAGAAALAAVALLASGSVVVAAGAAARSAAAAAGGSVAPELVVGVLAGVAGLAAWAWAALGRLLQEFVWVDYDENHCGKRS